ncbi:hypothetical protein GWI33_009473, partial [Rhynchophorus ferrugineus]
ATSPTARLDNIASQQETAPSHEIIMIERADRDPDLSEKKNKTKQRSIIGSHLRVTPVAATEKTGLLFRNRRVRERRRRRRPA